MESMEAGQDARECIEMAHGKCHAETSDANTVAVLCYVEARKAWSDGVTSLMSRLKDQASEEIAAIAGIEVKYDILAGLLQCDRLEELALAVGTQRAEEVQRLKARCEATTSGLAYMRLRWRVRGLR